MDTSEDIRHQAGTRMLVNRLRKNLAATGKWARRQGIDCYRLYDADMPEYAFAVDCYGARVHLQEYQAPSSISPEAAAKRRLQALAAIEEVLQPEQLVLKTRQRQKGKDQYTGSGEKGEDFQVDEAGARLWVNLERYLDTGLFLDHRPVRLLIRRLAPGKRFLNLFCYTASATVQAALGGATSSLSVDLSNTYLNWARRNFALNNLTRGQHRLIQKDCIAYLRNSSDKFDLILLDPPTFSNSKRTDNTLDIERDQVELVGNAMRLLSPLGLLIFSSNKRHLALDPSISDQFEVEDYSKKTIDRDFLRNPAIHQTWLIRHRN